MFFSQWEECVCQCVAFFKLKKYLVNLYSIVGACIFSLLKEIVETESLSLWDGKISAYESS